VKVEIVGEAYFLILGFVVFSVEVADLVNRLHDPAERYIALDRDDSLASPRCLSLHFYLAVP
jgi:hypothetical protein